MKHRKKKGTQKTGIQVKFKKEKSVNKGRTWKLGRKLRRLRAKCATKEVRKTNRREKMKKREKEGKNQKVLP